MAQRRPVYTGTVYQRKDGRWIGRLDVGYTANGTRRYKSVSGKTKRETEKKLATLKENLKDDVGLNTRTTVKAWTDEWLTMHEQQVAPSTYIADRSAVRQWIVPQIGKTRLTDLSPAHVRKVTGAARKAGRADTTITRIHAVTLHILAAAVQEGHHVPAPALATPHPRRGEVDRTSIPLEDATALLRAAPDTMRSRWAAALLQGMRQAECMGLTWDAVDLDAGTVDVSWQLKPLPYAHGCDGACGGKRGADCPQRRFRVPTGYEHDQIRGRWHLVRPKTRSGRRIIPLVPWMVTALRERRALAPDARFVWTDDLVERDEKTDTAEWIALQADAGITHPSGRPYKLHEARHTTATLLLALRVPPEVITAILGHSSIISSRAYMHTDVTMLRQALDGVAEALQLGA